MARDLLSFPALPLEERQDRDDDSDDFRDRFQCAADFVMGIFVGHGVS
jgi:hypothetical protein